MSRIHLTNNIIRAVPGIMAENVYTAKSVMELKLLFIIRKKSFIGIGLTSGPSPNCYITDLKQKNINSSRSYDDYNNVPHGGFTFGDTIFTGLDFGESAISKDLHWLGWDYAHAGDYSGYFPNKPNKAKKWTTPVLYEHTLEVINNFINLKI